MVSMMNPLTVHFFDEAGVKRTTGNRTYGHSRVGERAFEVQRYTSDVNLTLNLLHSPLGVSHFNIIHGPSNGMEMLHFFDEALQVIREDGNPAIRPGDVVIMDNAGFHHGGIAEPELREMLRRRNVRLLFQPPYCPEFNSCELCFRHIKHDLQMNDILAVNHTELALINAVGNITPAFSREFFRHCGFSM
ncbi:uncharacterized protein [Ptychodera flava]|uniref:uncharacterized protein n=1 Tax=Ptychodera flava TaxID=63121 RepID=UPI00396A0CD7